MLRAVAGVAPNNAHRLRGERIQCSGIARLWDFSAEVDRSGFALESDSNSFVYYLGARMFEGNCLVFRLRCWCLVLIGCHSGLHKRVFLGGRTHRCLLGLVTSPKLFGGLHMLLLLTIVRDAGLIFLPLRAH